MRTLTSACKLVAAVLTTPCSEMWQKALVEPPVQFVPMTLKLKLRLAVSFAARVWLLHEAVR